MNPGRNERSAAGAMVFVAAVLLTAGVGEAQTTRPAAWGFAVAGEPFGVGCLVVPSPARARAESRPESRPAQEEEPSGPAFDSALRLTANRGRSLYPAFISTGVLRGRFWSMGGLWGVGDGMEWAEAEERGRSVGEGKVSQDVKARMAAMPERGVAALFLFQGTGPVDVTLVRDDGAGATAHRVTLKPEGGAALHRAMVEAWWRVQCHRADEAAWADAYSPQVENFVVAMMSRRLGLKVPTIGRWWLWGSEFDRTFGLLLGTESIRMAMQKQMLLERAEEAQKLTEPLPEPVLPPAVELPAVKGAVPIEPMALHVPVECFYVRCGSFGNFRWMREFLDEWGTKARDLASSRALDYDIHGRLQRQLALKESALSKLLGDRAVADVAVIGTDSFVREGAAIGVIFQTVQVPGNGMLAAQLVRQRQAALKADGAARETFETIGGRKVSLISTPDNAVRSFYVVDGDYHFVTTSRALVRRFLEAGAGQGSLGASAEFRWGRSKRPLVANDKVFIYLSDAFFRNFLKPAYRVEMTRRMRAMGKIELVYLARCAARAEGKADKTVDDLIAGGFLPPTFAREADGGKVDFVDGRLVDSLRGARGSFLPVPDATIEKVTQAEADAYLEFVETYKRGWRRIDPVIVGIRHVPKTAEGRQRLTAEVYLTPYAKEGYWQLEQILGKPDSRLVAPVAGDLASLQVILGPQALRYLTPASGPATRPAPTAALAFAGLRDFAVPFSVVAGDTEPPWRQGSLGTPRGYIGVQPREVMEHALSREPTAVPPDKDGYAAWEGTSWVRVWDNFFVIGNAKETLQTVTPHLKVVAADRPAQVRLVVGDLGGTQVSRYLNAWGYLQTRKVSAGNVYFMHSLVRQLDVPAAEAKGVAENVLGAAMVCPLGGQYRLDERRPGQWVSTAWTAPTASQVNAIPAGYRFAPLDWFKGGAMEFAIDPEAQTLRSRLELDLAGQ